MTSRLHWVNVLAFVLQTLRPSVTRAGARVSHLALGSQPHRLLTPVFLHGGLGHLAVNTYSLQNLGPAVERAFGRWSFLATYLVSGVAGNIVGAYRQPRRPSVGASGAVCGLLGAYYVFVRRNRAFLSSSSSVERDLRKTLFLNVALGFMGYGGGNVDNWAHLGGALGGATYSYLMGPRLYLMSSSHTDTDGRRVLVNKPIVTLPAWTDFKWNRVRRRMRMDHHTDALSKRPRRK